MRLVVKDLFSFLILKWFQDVFDSYRETGQHIATIKCAVNTNLVNPVVRFVDRDVIPIRAHQPHNRTRCEVVGDFGGEITFVITG